MRALASCLCSFTLLCSSCGHSRWPILHLLHRWVMVMDTNTNTRRERMKNGSIQVVVVFLCHFDCNKKSPRKEMVMKHSVGKEDGNSACLPRLPSRVPFANCGPRPQAHTNKIRQRK